MFIQATVSDVELQTYGSGLGADVESQTDTLRYFFLLRKELLFLQHCTSFFLNSQGFL